MAVGEGLWSLESSILQKLAVRKHFSSVGFESVVERFESLSAILSFQVMNSNPCRRFESLAIHNFLFENYTDRFESLNANLSFQMMDSNPYVGDLNPWPFTIFYLKNTHINSNHFDLDSNHLVQI